MWLYTFDVLDSEGRYLGEWKAVCESLQKCAYFAADELSHIPGYQLVLTDAVMV